MSQLREHLLFFVPDPPAVKLTYTDQELDLARAYVVLAHAEIEAFCEELASRKARTAKAHFDSTATLKPVLRKMLAYYVAKNMSSWQDVMSPQTTTVQAAFASYSSVVHNNHGIRSHNLEKLYYPLGLLQADFEATWLAEMDNFGRLRGDWAHNAVGAKRPPDPAAQLRQVSELVKGLGKFEKALAKLR